MNPLIYSFMSHNFRCTVRCLWRRLRDRCSRRGAGLQRSTDWNLIGYSSGSRINSRTGGPQRSTDWNLIELGADGRSARNLSAANTTMPVARTVSLIV